MTRFGSSIAGKCKDWWKLAWINEEFRILAVRLRRFAFLIYYIVSITFRLCFLMPGFDVMLYPAAVFFDYLVDTTFLADSIIRLRFSEAAPVVPEETKASLPVPRRQSNYRRSMHIAKSIENVEHRQASAWRTFRSNADEVLNVFSVLPLELVAYAAGREGYYILRVTRLLRVRDYMKYWGEISEILHFVKIAPTSYAMKRVWLLVVTLAVVGHVGSCFFYAISLRSLRQGSTAAWVYIDGLATLDGSGEIQFLHTVSYRYLRAMYWSIQTLDTVGFGDITAQSEQETWFCILFFYVCAYLVYYTVANLMEVMTNYDSARTAALLKQSRFEQYATYRKLPKELVERVRSYYNHQWKLLKGVDEREIHAQLPPNLSQQVRQVVTRDLLAQVEVFTDLNKGLLNSLTDAMDSFLYNPEDIIVDRDCRVFGMYLIANGQVERSTLSGEKTVFLKRQAFCISSLLKSFSCPHYYIAKCFSEVLFLRGSVFRHVCKDYLHSEEYDKLVETKLRPIQKQEQAGVSRASLLIKPKKASSLRIRDVANRLQGIVYPDSEVRVVWDSLQTCALAFYLTSLPLLLAMAMHPQFISTALTLLVFGLLMDILVGVDWWLRSRYFGYREQGVIQLQQEKIWKHYWQINNYAVVILELFPWDLLFGLSLSPALYCVFRLLKLLHLRKFPFMISRFFQMLTYYTGWAVSFELSRFLALYFMLFQICHWAGNIWRLTASVGTEIFNYDLTWLERDRYSDNIAMNYASMAGIEYARSVYWAASVLSSVGFPDIVATNPLEYAVIIGVMFFGCLLFNTCLGAIAILMGSFNREKREFDLKVDKIKQVMRQSKIPANIEVSVVHYFDHLWTRYNGINEVEVLDSLPLTLKGAVIQHVVGPLVASIPFFAGLSEPMENLLLSMFEVRSFLDGDPLMIADELGKEMYIIEKGSVLVTSKDKAIEFARLGPGSYVGESCLLEVSVRMASVYAVGYVDTYVLTNDTFIKAAEKFPEDYYAIVREIERILESKRKVNKDKEQGLSGSVSPLPSANAAPVVAFAAGREEVEDGSGSAVPFLRTQGSEESLVKSVNGDGDSSSFKAIPGSLVDDHDGPLSSTRRTKPSPALSSTSSSDGLTLLPDSFWKISWDVFMCFVSCYFAIVIPLRLAVAIPEEIFWLDYFFDLMNWVDCYLLAYVFGRYQAGELVMNRTTLLSLYLKESVWFDVLACFPYDILGALYWVRASRHTFLIRSLLRLPRLLRLRYMSGYFKRIERILVDINVSYVVIRFAVLTLCILALAHWVACGWMMLATYAISESCENVADDDPSASLPCHYHGTWVEQQYLAGKLPASGGTLWDRYLRSFNLALPTLATDIVGDIAPMNQNESLYLFLIIFWGLSINGVIIGDIASLVSDVHQDNSRLYSNMILLRDYLVRKHLPPELIQSSVGFLQYLTTSEGMLTASRDTVFAELPHSMKTAIDKHMKTIPYLRYCPLFDFCSDELLRGISSKLRTQIYAKNDKIINFGDLGHEMFFLEKGRVEVLSEDEQTLYATLEEGSFFGETAMFFQSTRVATIRCASSIGVCLVLTKTDLNNELRSLDYDEEEILNIFRSLQAMNERRNEAVAKNLQLAKLPTSKLSKLIQLDNRNASETWFSHLRAHLTPTCLFRAIWDTLGLVWIVYYAFTVIWYAAFFFGEDVQAYTSRIAWEGFISVYWVVDMYCKYYLFSFYSDPMEKVLETDKEKIKARYLSSPVFKYDIVSSLPYEVLILVPQINSTTIFLIRALHLFRIFQLPDAIELVEKHIQYYWNWSLSRSMSLVLKAALLYFLWNHWLACGYFMLHRYLERSESVTFMVADDLSRYDPQAGKHDICSVASRYCYARCIYFVLGTMTSIGYGDLSPYTNLEITYQQAVALIGAYMGAILMGCCANQQADRDRSGENGFKRHLLSVEEYLKYRNLPSSLQEAITSQFSYRFKQSNSGRGDRDEWQTLLSVPSRMELMLILNQSILKGVPLIRQTCPQLQRRLALLLKPQFVLEGGQLYGAGDMGRTIFFTSSGRIEVTLSTDRKTLDAFGLAALRLLLHKQSVHGSHYEKGDHFGEFCLLSHSGLRAETAQAVTASEVYYLVKEELWEQFLYISPEIRLQFVFSLFTQIGEQVYIPHTLEDISLPRRDERDDRVISLYRMAFSIMESLYDHMDDEFAESSSEGEDGGEDGEDGEGGADGESMVEGAEGEYDPHAVHVSSLATPMKIRSRPGTASLTSPPPPQSMSPSPLLTHRTNRTGEERERLPSHPEGTPSIRHGKRLRRHTGTEADLEATESSATAAGAGERPRTAGGASGLHTSRARSRAHSEHADAATPHMQPSLTPSRPPSSHPRPSPPQESPAVSHELASLIREAPSQSNQRDYNALFNESSIPRSSRWRSFTAESIQQRLKVIAAMKEGTEKKEEVVEEKEVSDKGQRSSMVRFTFAEGGGGGEGDGGRARARAQTQEVVSSTTTAMAAAAMADPHEQRMAMYSQMAGPLISSPTRQGEGKVSTTSSRDLPGTAFDRQRMPSSDDVELFAVEDLPDDSLPSHASSFVPGHLVAQTRERDVEDDLSVTEL